jgi:hypothetical protein
MVFWNIFLRVSGWYYGTFSTRPITGSLTRAMKRYKQVHRSILKHYPVTAVHITETDNEAMLYWKEVCSHVYVRNQWYVLPGMLLGSLIYLCVFPWVVIEARDENGHLLGVSFDMVVRQTWINGFIIPNRPLDSRIVNPLFVAYARRRCIQLQCSHMFYGPKICSHAAYLGKDYTLADHSADQPAIGWYVGAPSIPHNRLCPTVRTYNGRQAALTVCLTFMGLGDMLCIYRWSLLSNIITRTCCYVWFTARALPQTIRKPDKILYTTFPHSMSSVSGLLDVLPQVGFPYVMCSPLLTAIFPTSMFICSWVFGLVACTKKNVKEIMTSGHGLLYSIDGNRWGKALILNSDTIAGVHPFGVTKHCLECGYTIRAFYRANEAQRQRVYFPFPCESYNTTTVDFKFPHIREPTSADIAVHHQAFISKLSSCLDGITLRLV